MANHRLFSPAANVLLARGGGINAPPEVRAKWPAPNHINPEERGWGAPIALVVILFLTLLVYIARMRARLIISRNAGIDDVLMSIAILPVVGLTVSTILGIRVYGFQWHMWDQTPASKITYTNITMAIEFCYMSGSTLIKISILFLYRRLTGSLTNKFVYAVWVCMAFCITTFLAFLLAIFFTCSPADPNNNCDDEGAILVAATAVSTVQDLIICFLPLFLIHNLQMPQRQKLALAGIFGLGVFTTVCGVMRTYYLIIVYYYTYDVTWYAYYGWIWTAVEADLGVICASVPALRIFFRYWFESIASRNSSSRSRNQNGSITLSNGRHHRKPAKHMGDGQLEAKGDHIVLQSIVVKRDLSSGLQERDDASQKSDSSTRNLTTFFFRPMGK